MRARGAIGSDLQFLAGNLARQTFDARGVCTPGTGQTDIGGVDAEVVHQVEQFEFLFDRRLTDGRRLQTIAQRFVVDADVAIGRGKRRCDCVPIVN